MTEESALLQDTPEVEIGGRKYRLRRLRTEDVFTASRMVTRALSNAGLNLMALGDLVGGFRVIAGLLTDDLVDWYASLLGVKPSEFREMPSEAAPAVLEALERHPDYRAFLTNVYRHLELLGSVLVRPLT